jgi:hypothetical protein
MSEAEKAAMKKERKEKRKKAKMTSGRALLPSCCQVVKV